MEHGTRTAYCTRHCRCDLCRTAATTYTRELRRRNAAAGKKRKYAPRNRNKYKDKVYAILEKSGCVVCGESDIVVLDFDHIDPSTKVDTISRMCKKHVSWARIEAEISKCQILCANCHRRKTAREQCWRKDRDSLSR